MSEITETAFDIITAQLNDMMTPLTFEECTVIRTALIELRPKEEFDIAIKAIEDASSRLEEAEDPRDMLDVVKDLDHALILIRGE